MYFSKLKYKLHINPPNILKTNMFWGSKYPYGLKYSDVGDENYHFFEIIPNEYKKYFKLDLLEINIPHVLPHIDNSSLVAINFYIKANNYETAFYKKITADPIMIKHHNHTNGGLFQYKDLEKQCSFVAKDNETFILNVNQVHSVRKLNSTVFYRKALVLNSHIITFDETMEFLKQQNLVDIE
jgi:hypothetical protein